MHPDWGWVGQEESLDMHLKLEGGKGRVTLRGVLKPQLLFYFFGGGRGALLDV